MSEIKAGGHVIGDHGWEPADLVEDKASAPKPESTSAAKRPASKKPAAKRPASKKPAAKKTASKKPAAKKPAAKKGSK